MTVGDNNGETQGEKTPSWRNPLVIGLGLVVLILLGAIVGFIASGGLEDDPIAAPTTIGSTVPQTSATSPATVPPSTPATSSTAPTPLGPVPDTSVEGQITYPAAEDTFTNTAEPDEVGGFEDTISLLQENAAALRSVPHINPASLAPQSAAAQPVVPQTTVPPQTVVPQPVAPQTIQPRPATLGGTAQNLEGSADAAVIAARAVATASAPRPMGPPTVRRPATLSAALSGNDMPSGAARPGTLNGAMRVPEPVRQRPPTLTGARPATISAPIQEHAVAEAEPPARPAAPARAEPEQAPVAAPGRELPRAPRQSPEPLTQEVAGVADTALRNALARLGAGIRAAERSA